MLHFPQAFEVNGIDIVEDAVDGSNSELLHRMICSAGVGSNFVGLQAYLSFYCVREKEQDLW